MQRPGSWTTCPRKRYTFSIFGKRQLNSSSDRKASKPFCSGSPNNGNRDIDRSDQERPDYMREFAQIPAFPSASLKSILRIPTLYGSIVDGTAWRFNVRGAL